MSFIAKNAGNTFSAGYFLVTDETCLRESRSIPADHAQIVTIDNRKVVPAGAIISGVGILYEDIDVTHGSRPGSVVVQGTVYGDLLPDSTGADQLDGITVVDYPTIERPY